MTAAQALTYLMGQVMAKTQGRADPHVARRVLVERLLVILTASPDPVP